MRVALYVRVSTQDQNCELQTRELHAFADREQWQTAGVYEDVMSGAKGRRPGLDRLMTDACEKTFDCILCWKLDRFGRSLVDCLSNIQRLENSGSVSSRSRRDLIPTKRIPHLVSCYTFLALLRNLRGA